MSSNPFWSSATTRRPTWSWTARARSLFKHSSRSFDGRLFAFDLGSTGGLRWGEIPRAVGWVNRGQLLRIGRYTIRLVGGDREGGDSIVEPAPTSLRYVSRLSLPGVAVEFRIASQGKQAGRQREELDQVLVLCGRSDRCRIRFDGHPAAKVTCTLIRTPKGLWMTNVLPTEVPGSTEHFADSPGSKTTTLSSLDI